jgi:heme/copper-type cytochrome/quinol oxidase subunit 4
MVENSTRPSLSVSAAALVLLTWSLVTFLGSMWFLKKAYAGSMSQFLLYAHSLSTATLDFIAILQIVFGLSGVVTSIGLLYLQERARRAAIVLSIVPVSIIVVALFLFLAASTANGAESLMAGFGFMFSGIVLVILLPLSIWWFTLFNRDKVRSQFR